MLELQTPAHFQLPRAVHKPHTCVHLTCKTHCGSRSILLASAFSPGTRMCSEAKGRVCDIQAAAEGPLRAWLKIFPPSCPLPRCPGHLSGHLSLIRVYLSPHDLKDCCLLVNQAGPLR